MKKLPKNLKINDKIEVEWIDHYTSPGWFKREQVKDKPCLAITMGYFQGHDDTYIYLVSTISDAQVGTILARIKSQVLRIRKLKPS